MDTTYIYIYVIGYLDCLFFLSLSLSLRVYTYMLCMCWTALCTYLFYINNIHIICHTMYAHYIHYPYIYIHAHIKG